MPRFASLPKTKAIVELRRSGSNLWRLNCSLGAKPLRWAFPHFPSFPRKRHGGVTCSIYFESHYKPSIRHLPSLSARGSCMLYMCRIPQKYIGSCQGVRLSCTVSRRMDAGGSGRSVGQTWCVVESPRMFKSIVGCPNGKSSSWKTLLIGGYWSQLTP